MKIIHTIEELRSEIKAARNKAVTEGSEETVGLVPTMGYLHDGHASLIRKARSECGTVVLSIFVNPIQFGPNEDFERYPRDPERDLDIAGVNGVDLVFMPNVREMYPQQTKTKVIVSDITDRLCGASRPGHFDGVATVVSKLFHIVQPDKAYFGLKDAQQVAVIRQMVSDLNMNVDVVPCPIIREPDGLALSSRNVYLSPEERKQALVLSQSLGLAEQWLKDAAGDVTAVKKQIEDRIRTSPLAVIDYVEIVAYPSLVPAERLDDEERKNTDLLIALAVAFGKTRLIDNRLFRSEEL